ncbi:MAG: UV damage repair endonuclease UvsE [Flavobacteriales bacterium]|jgi:UV DNA damage endonuclease|nr:UV damage repair endonuclease UvsE [Flavobacteriales bacterium]|tara:strand:+ start:1870 stop:2769 length:900 start_codon:yes stop_codon:yes gene_type:complete
MNLGYACINLTLSNNTPKITTNRSMVKKTFLNKGLDYASELGLANCKDLIKILKWNINNKIKFFRLSSEFFPWASEYNLQDLKDYNQIKSVLLEAGLLAKNNNLRLTAHPGPFNVLVSPRESVVKNTINDLSMHGEMFDLLGLERSPYNKINIHCNGVYGDKFLAMNRFCENYEKLPNSVQSRLTIENDDKSSMYSVKDLMYIHEKIGIPIVFDYHHHKFCDGGMSEKEALKLAVSTWPKQITPVVHYSESKSYHESNSLIKPQAHSDYINNIPKLYGIDVDIMVEAKAKELSILPFID